MGNGKRRNFLAKKSDLKILIVHAHQTKISEGNRGLIVGGWLKVFESHKNKTKTSLWVDKHLVSQGPPFVTVRQNVQLLMQYFAFSSALELKRRETCKARGIERIFVTAP